MNALIVADIEGIAGVYDFQNDAEQSSILYTREVDVCANTLLSNGVLNVTICDSHNEGNMINSCIIKKNVNLVSKIDNIPFENGYDLAILVGFHGMNERQGIYAHSYRFDIKEITIKDKPVGEVEVVCRTLGGHGLPVILVTGDIEATYEANYYNPYRHICCVKSLYQSSKIDYCSLYKKLSASVELALKLDKTLCISHDDDEVEILFYNPDVVSMLDDYEKNGEKLTFKNCREFEAIITNLAYRLNEINLEFLNTNNLFLKDLKKRVKHLSMEEMHDPNIKDLLTKNRFFLDETSRKKIIEYVSKSDVRALD